MEFYFQGIGKDKYALDLWVDIVIPSVSVGFNELRESRF